MKRLVLTGGITGMLAALVATSPALALTRPEYVAQADQICKAASAKFKKLAKPLKKKFRKLQRQSKKKDLSKKQALRVFKGLFRAIGTYDIRAARVAGNVFDQIRTLPPPPEDLPTISAWIQANYDAVQDVYDAGRAYRHLKLGDAQEAEDAADADSKEADRIVTGYGFRECADDSRKGGGGPKL